MKSHAELLLVEAKGNVEELNSTCSAQEHGGLPLIRSSLNATKTVMEIAPEANWLSRYYQYCNRLATLHFLTVHNVPCRLLFVYFCGDVTPHRTCPRGETEWIEPLEHMYKHIGLEGEIRIREQGSSPLFAHRG